MEAHDYGARAPGLVTPELTIDPAKKNAPELGGVGGEQIKSSSTDGTATCAEGKALATLAARAALAGAALHRLAGGGFLLTRWGWAAELPDLAAVAARLDRMNGGGK